MEKLFYDETETIEKYHAYLYDNQDKFQNDKQALENLLVSYRDLLEQSRFITKVSDRLEKKLEMANEALTGKNEILQRTLEALTRARAGKKARAIIYSLAIGLFVFEEIFIEPFITLFNEGMWTGLLIKLAIVIMLKPAEIVVENAMLNRMRKA